MPQVPSLPLWTHTLTAFERTDSGCVAFSSTVPLWASVTIALPSALVVVNFNAPVMVSLVSGAWIVSPPAAPNQAVRAPPVCSADGIEYGVHPVARNLAHTL